MSQINAALIKSRIKIRSFFNEYLKRFFYNFNLSMVSPRNRCNWNCNQVQVNGTKWKKLAKGLRVLQQLMAWREWWRPIVSSWTMAWAVMTPLSLAAGSFVIASTIEEYLKYDVVTQTKRIHPQSILLPSVTFCSGSNMLELIKTAVYDAPDMTGLTHFVPGIKQEENEWPKI